MLNKLGKVTLEPKWQTESEVMQQEAYRDSLLDGLPQEYVSGGHLYTLLNRDNAEHILLSKETNDRDAETKLILNHQRPSNLPTI